MTHREAPDIAQVDQLTDAADQHLRDSETQRALGLAQTAYEMAVALAYPLGQARSLSRLATANELLGNRAIALAQALDGLNLAQALADLRTEVDLRLTILILSSRMGLFDQAVAHGLAALPLCRQLADRRSEAIALSRLGIAYTALGDLHKAHEMEQHALMLRKQEGDLAGMAISLNNMIHVHMQLGDMAQAGRYAEQCLQVCQTLEQQGQTVSTYAYLFDNMGELALRAGNLDQALHYLQQAITFNRDAQGAPRFSELESFLLLNLGRIYRMRGSYDHAKATFEAAGAYCQRTHDNANLISAYRELAELYEQHGHFPQALQQLRLASQLQSQLRSEQSTIKIRTLQTLYETEQAHLAAATYQQKNTQQKQIITELEQTQQQLQQALADVQRRIVEQERLLAENTQLRETIHKISTPVLPLTEGILVAPLIGALDSKRMQHFQSELLHAIQHHSAELVLIDITGVPLVDSQVAQGLLSTVQTASMLGSSVILVGIRPEVAQAIVALGIDLQQLNTNANLQSALARIDVLGAARYPHIHSKQAVAGNAKGTFGP